MQSLYHKLVRPVLRSTGIAHWRFRRHEWRASRRAGAVPATDEDGLALPGRYLMYLVVANSDWKRFLQSGRETADFIADCVDRHGGNFAQAGSVLDLGCGCGRVMRHMPKLTGAALHGFDYNKRLVRWCRDNLPGEYKANRLPPPLDCRDGQFDVAYLLSVFTHLLPETQAAWIGELARVIRPGGIALISIHDEDHAGLARVGLDRDVLLTEGVHVHNTFSEGSNIIATFQTRDWSRRLVQPHFDVLSVIGHDRNPTRQTMLVLQRRNDQDD